MKVQGQMFLDKMAQRMKGPEKVTEALREAGIPGIKYLDQGSRVDNSMVQLLEGHLADAKAAGNTADVARYEQRLAEEQQKAKNQTSNYVVFSDDLIKIIRKYGLAGLIAGGASHFALSPVEHDPFEAQ